ncbi:hypothetical protein quinque_008504 [Culex quinquefasciatus]|uniref:basic salivary proline-rich protein 1-like n=1 Tax=Culex pipiens pallens TaxID=42434 RepID=UPI0019540314|nr:basic salivary proline-rich protein 1-like [Culex pipiens pallens]
MAKLTSCSVFALFAVALVFVGTTRAAPGADVLRARRSPQFPPGMPSPPSGFPSPPMLALNRVVRQAPPAGMPQGPPEGMPPPPEGMPQGPPSMMTAIYRRTRETRQGEAGESMLDGSRMRREARGGGGKFPNRSG